MKKLLRILLIISVLISFCFFLRATNIPASVDIIRHLGFSALWILISTFGAYLFGALGWKFCIDSTSKPPLGKLFIYRHTGNTIALFNPTSVIAGELYNARMLEQQGVDERIALKSVLLARIIMMLSLLTLSIVSLGWLLYSLSDGLPRKMKFLLIISFAIVVLLLLSLSYFSLRRGDVNNAGNSLTDENRKKWKKIIRNVREMRSSLAEYIRKRPQEAIFSFVFFSLHWILGSLEIYFILSFLGFDIKVWNALLIDTGIILIKSMGAFIPGQLGVEELGNKLFLSVIGINSYNIWLSVSILRRSRQLFWSCIGFLFYITLRNIKSLKG